MFSTDLKCALWLVEGPMVWVMIFIGVDGITGCGCAAETRDARI